MQGRTMMLGLSLSAFTTLHVIISLIAIAAGLVVFYGWLIGWESMTLTHVFLATTVLTTVTGFMFPFIALLPSHITGFVSAAALVPALYALYGKHAVGGWRKIYLITALIALYLNCFVLVVQMFLKIPTLRALAPNGNELPFLAAQIVVLVLFIWFGYRAVKHSPPAMA
jgi:hypothetical protein